MCRIALGALFALSILSGHAIAQTTVRVSISSSGMQKNGGCYYATI